MVLFFTLKSLTHLEFILVRGVRYSSNLILSLVFPDGFPGMGGSLNHPSFLTDLKFCLCHMLTSFTCLTLLWGSILFH